MSTTRMLLMHAVTPLHVGTGRGEGIIDLPVARDRVTRHPILPGSGVKGPLRAACANRADQIGVFGPETDGASEHASAVRFSDARLIAMPCPSDFGTFAWVTSPLVLKRWSRDAAHIVSFPEAELPAFADASCCCAADSVVRSGDRVVIDGQGFGAVDLAAWPEWLSGLVFPDDAVWRRLFRERLVVVSDAVFDDLAVRGTDVRAHIRIDPKTGTVSDGALWYEESVPAEAIFASVTQFVGGRVTAREAIEVIQRIVAEPITFGGGKTTGMGVMRCHLHGGT